MGILKKIKDTAEKGTELSKKGIEKSTELSAKSFNEAKDVVSKESLNEQLNTLKKEGLRLKKLFQSKEVIQLKTDSIAILLRKMGKEEEFFAAYEQLTKEGYKLVLLEELRELPIAAGFNFQVGVYFYFQHKKYIT